MFIYAHLETLSAMIIRCFLMHSNLNKEREILLYMDSGILQGKKKCRHRDRGAFIGPKHTTGNKRIAELN